LIEVVVVVVVVDVVVVVGVAVAVVVIVVDISMCGSRLFGMALIRIKRILSLCYSSN